jgi:hypothetical protein
MSDRIMLQERPSAESEEKPAAAPPTPEPRQEPERQAPEPDPPPPAAAEAGQAATEGEQQQEPPLGKDELSQLKERYDALNREKWEARRQAEMLAARVAELERPAPPPGQPQDPVEVAKQQLRAEEMQRSFNAACNATFAKGKAEFPDFEQAVGALNAVGAGQRPDFLSAVTALPEGHKVYRQLAGNLDEAARVLALPPMQMAVELAKMAVVAATPVTRPPPQVSNAPPPIRPIGGASRNPTPANESMEEFIARRDKEAAARRRI